MDKISIFLSFVMLVAMLMLIAPGTMARNRGKMLRNVALWLAIFTALALAYRLLGPGSEHPLFSAPAVTLQRNASEPPATPEIPAKTDDDKGNGSHGFMPPSE